MLDINHLRNNLKDVQDNLKKRGFVLDAKQFNSLDSERKLLQTETESLQEKSNILAKEISVEKSQEAREQKLKKSLFVCKYSILFSGNSLINLETVICVTSAPNLLLILEYDK